jgi:hypothetical protein
MYIGLYDIPKCQLKKASHKNLLRLARYLKLRYGLLDMSHRQLAKLVRWRLTRGEMRC